MSLESTLARADARTADDAWKQHRRQCATCSPAARRRRWDELCARGTELRTAQAQAADVLKQQLALDRQSDPRGLKLF